MSIIRTAIKELMTLEKIKDGSRDIYNRYRNLEELINDYKANSRVDFLDFKDVYYGYRDTLGLSVKVSDKKYRAKKYNEDYYSKEIINIGGYQKC